MSLMNKALALGLILIRRVQITLPHEFFLNCIWTDQKNVL